jgi:hypothetical protein
LALRLQMSTPRRNAISTALTNSPRKSHEPNDVCRESDINMWKIARSDRKATIGMCPDEFKIKIVHRLFAARNGSMEANIIKRKNCERRYITNNYYFPGLTFQFLFISLVLIVVTRLESRRHENTTR